MYFKLPALADDEVRLKILHAGMCHSDCFKCDELWGPNATFPLVPGHEIIAEVEKLGAKVTDLKVGDAVGVGCFRDCCGACEQCRKGDDQLCTDGKNRFTYDPHLGGYSTHMQIKSGFCFPLPKNLNKSKSAPLFCAGLTVFSPLKRWCIPGARCGVIGIGGLGHMAVQIASKMGMKVVAISTTPAKEKEAKMLGAREFVCSKNEEQMKYIQTKEKLDLLINTVYVPDITNYMYTVKPGGRFIQVGAPDISKPLIFNTMDLVCNQKILTGSLVGSRKETVECLDFCEKFECAPIVENYKWAETPKAYKRLHDGLPRYRCVIDVASIFDNL
jgi:uncharacterized zinc-type alcohol dehydrogenase-like protein